MRLCHNCRNWNSGWPIRCRNCGVGLEGRMCARHHVNPFDPRLSFCGECGQPLERKWGAGFSVVPYVLAFAISLGTILLSALVISFANEAPMTSALIALVILVIGFRIAFQILPPWVRNAANDVAQFLLRLVLGTGK